MENIDESWKQLFYKHEINLDNIYNSEDVIYPSRENIFKVFEMNVNDIKLVILGQDPYHNPNQAHGLSFSVPLGMKVPPSLKNIYKELLIEFPERKYIFNSGNLERWFSIEKIFLLNSALSVIHNKPASHMKKWQNFTNDVIKYISENNKKCVFLLLGNFAKSKAEFISNKENIITGVHPSPLSANKGFFYSNVFIMVENKLGEKINWSL
jgi:uracil-DNA glycosylase